MDKNQNNQQSDQQGGAGRTFNSQPHNEQQGNQNDHSDISSIDQQEGAMNHGEKGGGGSMDQQQVSGAPKQEQ